MNLAYREYLDDNVALADELLDGCPADLSDWEWDYAHRLGHSELKTFAGSSQGRDVWSVAFSPTVRAGRRDRALGPGRRRADRRAAGPLGSHRCRGLGGARADRRGPGRGVLAGRPPAWRPHRVSPARRRARSWPLRVARRPKVWREAERGPRSSAWRTPPTAGRSPAVADHFNEYAAGGFGRLRDAATGEPLGQPITGGPGGVLGVAFSPTAASSPWPAATSSTSGTCPARRRPIVHRLRGHVNFVYAVAFQPGRPERGDRRLGQDHPALGPETGALLQTLIGHRGFVRGLAFSPDGTQLVSGSEDKSVRRWDLAGGGENAAFHGHTGFVHCVAFGPDGALAASGSLDGTVKLWPAAAPDSQVTFRNSAGWVGTVAFAPDGRRIASAHNGNIRIWDPRTGEELHRLDRPAKHAGTYRPGLFPRRNHPGRQRPWQIA